MFIYGNIEDQEKVLEKNDSNVFRKFVDLKEQKYTIKLKKKLILIIINMLVTTCSIVVDSINTSAKTLNNDVNFKRIIEHTTSTTLEKEDIDVPSGDVLRFRTIHKVINVRQMRLHQSMKPCLERGKT